MIDDYSLGIGFDLDGVLADIATQLLRFIRQLTGIVLPADALTSEDIETCTPLTRDQLVSIFRDPTFFRMIPLFGDARRSMNALRNQGYSIHIVTDRFWYEGLHRDTERWLGRYRLPFDSLQFARRSEKAEVVSRLRLRWFVEDQLSNANSISQHCRVVLLDRPYNQGVQTEAVKRVDTLVDAVAAVLNESVPTSGNGIDETL